MWMKTTAKLKTKEKNNLKNLKHTTEQSLPGEGIVPKLDMEKRDKIVYQINFWKL